MIHLLCLNPRIDARPEQLAEFIDGLEVPYEWQDLPNASVDRVIVIRCESVEDLAEKMKTIPDHRIMTHFGFSKQEEKSDV